jgi:Cu(I)/Ag(I) efflux system membrane fusion protein
MQTIGVRTSAVRVEDFGRLVRAFGAVEENIRLQSVVSARVEGWIEGLAITAVGDAVEKGDLLFRLYSPDLIAAQRDFLVAAKSGSEARAASAARRLKSLGLQDEAIAALRARGSLEERAPVYADRNGVVSALDVREGAFVRPGGRIAEIQDYAEVWVIAALAEQDLAAITPGLPVNVEFPNIPGAERAGTVDYIYPTVDPKTRTGKVRIVLDNADDVLRPGAYADVSITIDAGERLAVPSEALLRDSRGAHVVLALGEGRFAPADVETGIAAMGVTEIVSGLEAGDEVVVSGQFLIDSESSLRESFRKMSGGEPADDREVGEHKGHH